MREASMKPILTRCGYRCDLCQAYRPNIEKHPENRQKLSDGWHKYFGFRILASDVSCDGCMAENPNLLDKGCPVRPCVIERKLQNCASCGDYDGCEKLAQRLVTYEEVRARAAMEIPQDDRRRFIEPYENKGRLEALRKS
jgi:hypothetical protein